jgi:hypothetical protein
MVLDTPPPEERSSPCPLWLTRCARSLPQSMASRPCVPGALPSPESTPVPPLEAHHPPDSLDSLELSDFSL